MEFLKFGCCLTVEHGYYMFDFVIRRKGECWACCMPSISQFSSMIMRVSACIVLGLQQGSWCFCFSRLHVLSACSGFGFGIRVGMELVDLGSVELEREYLKHGNRCSKCLVVIP